VISCAQSELVDRNDGSNRFADERRRSRPFDRLGYTSFGLNNAENHPASTVTLSGSLTTGVLFPLADNSVGVSVLSVAPLPSSVFCGM
jgi:hypothetical protein